MASFCSGEGLGASQDATARTCVLVIAVISSFLPPFMASSINIALPAIGSEFSMDAVLLGWIATSYLLAAAVFLVPFGRLADIYGMKRIFASGLFIYTVSSLLSAMAPSADILIAVRVLQGIGSAMLFGTATAILISVFPPHERGRVLGINVASVYVGLSVGPFIGGFLTQLLGWRSLFFINVPLGLVPLFLVLWVLKGEWAGAKGEKFDLAGSLLYSLMLISLMYGFTRLPGHLGKLMVLAGLLGFVGLIWWESRAKSPVLDVMLFRKNRVYAFSNLAALINYSATFAVGFLMSLYLQYIKGLEPLAAGTILVAQPLMMAVFSPFAGRLSDKIEPRIVASFGMALTFAGVLIFTFIQADTSISFIVAGLVFLGIGIAFFSSPNTNAIMSSIERRHYGVGSATLGTMRLVGQVLSMGVVMLVLAVYMGRVEILRESYPEFMASMKTAFTICTLLCFIGIFASLARGDMRAKPQ